MVERATYSSNCKFVSNDKFHFWLINILEIQRQGASTQLSEALQRKGKSHHKPVHDPQSLAEWLTVQRGNDPQTLYRNACEVLKRVEGITQKEKMLAVMAVDCCINTTSSGLLPKGALAVLHEEL